VRAVLGEMACESRRKGKTRGEHNSPKSAPPPINQPMGMNSRLAQSLGCGRRFRSVLVYADSAGCTEIVSLHLPDQRTAASVPRFGLDSTSARQ
jgi:hypothetical protein